MGALLKERIKLYESLTGLSCAVQGLPGSAAPKRLLAGISHVLWGMTELCLQATLAQCCGSQRCDLSEQS